MTEGTMIDIDIRLEEPNDYDEVERITREAFWNLYCPGCNEHYLVNKMRTHKDFIKELGLVATIDNQIIANIMYAKSSLENLEGKTIPIVSFGPVSVLPEYQRKGVGGKLIQKTIATVKALGYPAIVIWGHPGNYAKHGFKNCKKFNISISQDKYPTALLVLELKKDVMGKEFLFYKESDVYEIDDNEAEEFDKSFEKKEKRYQYSQEEFDILSHSSIS